MTCGAGDAASQCNLYSVRTCRPHCQDREDLPGGVSTFCSGDFVVDLSCSCSSACGHNSIIVRTGSFLFHSTCRSCNESPCGSQNLLEAHSGEANRFRARNILASIYASNQPATNHRGASKDVPKRVAARSQASPGSAAPCGDTYAKCVEGRPSSLHSESHFVALVVNGEAIALVADVMYRVS